MSFPEQLILDALPILLPVLIAVLTYVVKSAIERLPSNKQTFVRDIVYTMVTATEQQAGAAVSGPTKKQEVLAQVMSTLSHFHMSVPESFVSALIEETVFALNQTKTGATIVNENMPLQPRG